MRILVACLIACLFAGFAIADEHMLVRFYLDTPADEAYVRSNPDHLDITESGRAGLYVDIVLAPGEIDLLNARATRLEILQENLESHYASRLSRDTNFGIYHTYSEAVAWMDSLHEEHPDVVSAKWSLGLSIEGREIWCCRVSDNPEIDENEPEILFDGLHHAREVMSSEMVLMLIEYLAENYGSDPEVTELVNERETYMVPIVNPDGFVYNESTHPNGGGMWRKNRRNNGDGTYGVDPNRNYPYEWGCSWGSSGDPGSETYRGTAPGSEPEVQAMMTLINAHDFVVRQSIHTYSELTLYPWGYTTDDTPDEATFRMLAAEMVKYNGYVPGQPGDILYDVCGGSFDWDYGAQDEHTKIFGFTNEIGNYSDGFWPSEARRQQLFEDNLWPSLYLIDMTGRLRAVSVAHAPLPFTPDMIGAYELSATPEGYEGTAVDPSTVYLHYSVDGGATVDQLMQPGNPPGSFDGAIPAQFQGSEVEYYISAGDVDGHSGNSPFNAPDDLHYFEVGESFTHAMDADRGWTVGDVGDDASSGIWDRVDPVATIAQPGDDHSAEGTDCWITGQQQAGQSDGWNDVDNGATTLFSPTYAFTGAESATFSYWKWYSNDQGSDPNNDYWDVLLSNNDGGSWTSLEHTTTSTNAWVQVSVDVLDHFAAAGDLKVKFIASDEGSGSLVEAGVDDFIIAGVFDQTGLGEDPAAFSVRLDQNVPNPFNPVTRIAFTLAEAGPVSLRVYDVSGRLLATLAEGLWEAGEHELVWNGRDLEGRPASSGVYFYTLQAEGRTLTKKMVILK